MYWRGPLYFLVFLFIADHHDIGIEFKGLLDQQVIIVMGSEHFHRKLIGISGNYFNACVPMEPVEPKLLCVL